MANLFLGIFYNLSVWYKLNDLTKYGAIIAITGSIVTIAMNLWLVPTFSYLGAAWGHFACYLVMMIISYYWGRKIFPVNYDIKRILLYFGLAMILYAASNYLKPDVLYLQIVINSFLLVIFLSFVYFGERKQFRPSL